MVNNTLATGADALTFTHNNLLSFGIGVVLGISVSMICVILCRKSKKIKNGKTDFL
mgnify:CR=1 FL=1